MAGDAPKPRTRHYRRATFVTRLPETYLYSPSHCWVERRESDRVCRVGVTRFASRMLGEMVDFGFEAKPGATVKPGQIVGWMEGFKAISDVYCVIAGEFAGSNPDLEKKIDLIDKDSYFKGWLYEAVGEPDAKCMTVDEYIAVLDKTIDKILENQKADEIQ